MHRPLLSLRVGIVVALLGCGAPSVEGIAGPDTEPAVVSGKSTRATNTSPESASAGDIAWGERIAWRSWDDALLAAKAQGKPVCLVVYADWCPRCKELAPVFSTPEVARAAEHLLMVRQDQDEQPPWLQEQLGKYGKYVPRVLFLDPSGKVREDLTSGHPRYPYFYAPMVTDALLANMHAARGRPF